MTDRPTTTEPDSTPQTPTLRSRVLSYVEEHPWCDAEQVDRAFKPDYSARKYLSTLYSKGELQRRDTGRLTHNRTLYAYALGDAMAVNPTTEAPTPTPFDTAATLAEIKRLTAQRRILIIQRDKAVDALENMTAERDVLRSQLASRREWREGIPTPEQLEHHEQHGGLWLVRDPAANYTLRFCRMGREHAEGTPPGSGHLEHAPVDMDVMPAPWLTAEAP